MGAADTVHHNLELKHVQLDSLGYIMSRHYFAQGHFKAATTVYANTLKFFTGNYKDVRIVFLIFTAHLSKPWNSFFRPWTT